MMYRILLLGSILIGGTKVIAQDWAIALDSVMNILAEEDFFDGQILIAEKGKVLFNQAYGNIQVNGESKILTEDTALPVFSVGKSFTALSVMLLEAEGKLRYEDPVRKYIPELPYEKVTVRHLLTMTSGLPRFLETALQKVRYWHLPVRKVYRQLSFQVWAHSYFHIRREAFLKA